MSDPNRSFTQPASSQQLCPLINRLPTEITTMILELVLLPPLPLTIRTTNYFEKYRPQSLNEAITAGQGSCQAQLLRTCQLLYTLSLNLIYQKATFRLSVHCEGRNNMARTAHPLKPNTIEWVPVFYSRSFGRKLLKRFQHIYYEICPDMGGTSADGIFIPWTSTGVMVDTHRFLAHRLKGKHLTVNFTTPNLETDRILLDELGIWLGALEVLRVKSLEVPQFKHWMKANRQSCPMALVVSNEPVVDLESTRLDLVTLYFEKMRAAGQPGDRYYDETLSTRFRERAHQFNVRDFVYLRNLFIDRIEAVTKETFDRPVEHDRKLLEIYARFTKAPAVEEMKIDVAE